MQIEERKLKLLTGATMRLKMAALIIIARLTWGELVSPLYWKRNLGKFFPPPVKVVYKELLANYFSRN